MNTATTKKVPTIKIGDVVEYMHDGHWFHSFFVASKGDITRAQERIDYHGDTIYRVIRIIR